MKRFGQALAILSFTLAPLLAFGAGGIERNGEVLTIGSSGLKVELDPLSSSQLPELVLTTQVVKKLILPTEIMGGFLKELRPSTQRKFYKVKKISIAEERAMVEAYREILPDLPSTDHLTLFAMTDVSKKESYLLPAYFQLKTAEQRAAILFHEGLVAYGFKSHQKLIQIENAMEGILNCKTNPSAACPDEEDRMDELQNRLTSTFPLSVRIQITLQQLQIAAMSDAAGNQLAGIMKSNGELSIAKFLGTDLFKMLQADLSRGNSTQYSDFPVNYREVRLSELSEEFPKSRLIKVLLNSDLNLNFIKYRKFSKSVWSLKRGGPALKDPKVTAISQWNYGLLNIKFDQKPLSYHPEVLNYWLNNYQLRDEDSNSSYERRQEAEFFGTSGIFHGVLPVDISLSTKLRKLYVELEKNQDSNRDYDYEPNEVGGTYYYYLFGLTLTGKE